jgi:hypothetical protein
MGFLGPTVIIFVPAIFLLQQAQISADLPPLKSNADIFRDSPRWLKVLGVVLGAYTFVLFCIPILLRRVEDGETIAIGDTIPVSDVMGSLIMSAFLMLFYSIGLAMLLSALRIRNGVPGQTSEDSLWWG